MAQVQNTLLGRAKGRVGNAVFSTWKGRNILKQKAESVANPRSAQQQANRARFTALLALGRNLRPLCQIGFKEYASTVTWLNRFMSTNTQSGAFEWNDNTTEWEQKNDNIVIAEGSLMTTQVAIDHIINTGPKSNITLSWDTSTEGNKSPDDRLFGILFTESTIVFQQGTKTRGDGSVSMDIDPSATGQHVQVITFFASADLRIVSNSINSGSIVIPMP